MLGTLAQILDDVFSLYRPDGGPFPADVRAKLEAPGRRVTLAGPNLSVPPWGLGAGSANDVFVELEPDHECEGVGIADQATLGATSLAVSIRDLPLADVEKVIGKTKEPPRIPGRPRRASATKSIAGRNIAINASVRDGRVYALELLLPRAAVAQVEITPGTTAVASLEHGGERFEARRYPHDGVIDVVRYSAAGAILEKKTFTWNSQYMLRGAKLVHVTGDRFSLEIWCEHWKGGTPYEEAFGFGRG